MRKLFCDNVQQNKEEKPTPDEYLQIYSNTFSTKILRCKGTLYTRQLALNKISSTKDAMGLNYM